MRNILYSLSIIYFLLIQGCSDRQSLSSDKKKIVSTIAQIGDLVQEIGKDRIETSVLVRGELNPHSYELVKGDGDKILKADLVFYNGLGLEHGASVAAILETHPNAVALGDEIIRRHPEKILKREETIDPHIWMDVSLWKEAIDPITEHLIQIDPEGESLFLQRAQLLKDAMDETDFKIKQELSKVPPEKRYLVTSHDAFQYFTRRYLAVDGEADWEKRFAAPEGLAPDGQLSIADLRAIVDHLKEYKISIIFPESNVNRDSLRKISDITHVRICNRALFGDSIRGSYLDSMMQNGQILAEELNQ